MIPVICPYKENDCCMCLPHIRCVSKCISEEYLTCEFFSRRFWIYVVEKTVVYTRVSTVEQVEGKDLKKEKSEYE